MNSRLAFLSSHTQYVLGSSYLPGTVLSISLVLSHMNPSDSVFILPILLTMNLTAER